MRTFFLLQHVHPDSQKSLGFVYRNGSGRKEYRLVKADHATLYTTRGGVKNSMRYAFDGLKIETPKGLSYYDKHRFIRKNFKVVEVQALLWPSDGFLDKVLG